MKNVTNKKKASTNITNNGSLAATAYDNHIRNSRYTTFFNIIETNNSIILKFLEGTTDLKNYKFDNGDGGVLSQLIHLTNLASSQEKTYCYAMQLARFAQYYIKKHNFDPNEIYYYDFNFRELTDTHLTALTKNIGSNPNKFNHFKPLLYVFTEERIPAELMNDHQIEDFEIPDYDGKRFYQTYMYQYLIGNYKDEGEAGRCDINQKDSLGKTALMYAIENGVAELVKFFLDHGADVCRIKNNDGKSAIDLALESSNDQIKALFNTHELLEKLKNKETEELEAFCNKINITVVSNTNTLSYFIKDKDTTATTITYQIKKFLTQYTQQQDINQVVLKIIKLAIQEGNTSLVNAILAGIFIDRSTYTLPQDTQDEYGDTILSYAQRSESENNAEIVELIQKKGGVLPTEETVFQILEAYITTHPEIQHIELLVDEQKISSNDNNNISVEQQTPLSVVKTPNGIVNEETKEGGRPLDNNNDEPNSNRNGSKKKKKTVTFVDDAVEDIVTSPVTDNQNPSDTTDVSNSNMENEVLTTNNKETNDTLSVTSLENRVISPITDETKEEINNSNPTEAPLEIPHSGNRSVIGGIYSILKNVYDSSLTFVMQSLTYVWKNISFSTNQSNNISTDISPIITEETNVAAENIAPFEEGVNTISPYRFEETEKCIASILNNENINPALLNGMNSMLKKLPKDVLSSIAYHVMSAETEEVKIKFSDNIMDKLFDESEKSSILEKVKSESAKNMCIGLA